MSLKTLQKDFKEAALRDESDGFLKEQLPYDLPESQDRFWVYRNNILENLVGVLENTYGACVKLVGNDYFKQCAREFVKKNLPQEASLYKYGQGFVEYFNSLGKQHNYAYWGDVAAFEWAESECFFEQDVNTLGLQDLASYGEEAFANLSIYLSPAVRLLKTDFNVQEIVQATKGDDSEDLEVIQSPHYYLFYRDETKVFADPINNIIFGALQSLTIPISLADLAEKFSQQGCEKQFGSFIQMLFKKEITLKAKPPTL